MSKKVILKKSEILKEIYEYSAKNLLTSLAVSRKKL